MADARGALGSDQPHRDSVWDRLFEAARSARDRCRASRCHLSLSEAPGGADLVCAKHPHPFFPTNWAKEKDADGQLTGGGYWTRKQPITGSSLLQAIL